MLHWFCFFSPPNRISLKLKLHRDGRNSKTDDLKLILLSYTAQGVVEWVCVPIVGMVVTISPSLSLYRMVVLPAASRPTIRILISFFPNRPLKRFAKTFPILSGLIREKREREMSSINHHIHPKYGSSCFHLKQVLKITFKESRSLESPRIWGYFFILVNGE